MKGLTFFIAAAAFAAPALAQHQGHGDHQAEQAPDPAVDPHAGHDMTPAPPPAPPPAPVEDPHAGHDMTPAPAPAPAVDPHAGHDMTDAAPAAPTPPVRPPPAEALSGPAHAADRIFGDAVMADAREDMHRTHGDILTSKFLIDRIEARIADGEDGWLWDAQFWWGGDIDKLWIKTEGEGAFGGSTEAEAQILWSHAIDPWFDLQIGVRQDFATGPDRTHIVAGLQGLAPYWFEVDGAVFLSDKGDLTARFEGEYDLRITQRLILQPRLEVDLAAQDVPELGIGSGLTSAALGMRLRYEIEPEFAPYVGIEYERAFGDSADFARAAGEDPGGWALLLGVRAWF